MTLPAHDWAHAAYEAALRRDLEAALGALAPLIHDGRDTVDVAMRAWIDRTYIVMDSVMRQHDTVMGVQLEMENAGGDTVAIDQVPLEAAWAGRMFMAHTTRNRALWDALWSTVPADAEAITDHVLTLLQAMAATAENYAQHNQPHIKPCCHVHAYVDADPMLAAGRAAMAHYN